MSTILDLRQLKEIFGSDTVTLNGLLAEVADDADHLVLQIEGACAREAWSEACVALHELIGMCAAAGCVELAELGTTVQAAAAEGRDADISPSLALLVATGQRLHTHIGGLSLETA